MDAALLAIIKDAVQKKYDGFGTPLFIADMTRVVRAGNMDLKAELGGRKLKDVLSEYDGKEFQLVRETDRTDDIGWALIPLGVDKAQAFEHRHTPAASLSPVDEAPLAVRYDLAAWSAFLIPLKEDERRFLKVNSNISFRNVPDGDTPPDDHIHVDGSLIRKSSDPVVKVEIERNLLEWARLNNVSPETLKQKNQERAVATMTHGRLLDFSRLSEHDQARILIPMDIVLKILIK